MEKGTKIFLADDFKPIREIVKRVLISNDYYVVVEAVSLNEALGKIDLAKEKGVTLAILDGDLGTGRSDGPTINKALREKIPGIKIISHSGLLADWGHINLRKPSGPKEMIKAIESL